ncbi:MAG: DUF1917 domain-containing protein [Anaerolineae bacterium]|jgi:hypothetical protein|nr:DUF1917 domain-containing protein [Anaerolineae bacterium]
MTDDTPMPPNLDLIQMVQRARMLHDADAKPSEMDGNYWVEHKPSVPVAPPTPRAGRWVIETDIDQLDALWERVKQANAQGELGYKAKATAKARNGTDPRQRLIVVCVADSDDAADVARVRGVLESMGLGAALHYER